MAASSRAADVRMAWTRQSFTHQSCRRAVTSGLSCVEVALVAALPSTHHIVISHRYIPPHHRLSTIARPHIAAYKLSTRSSITGCKCMGIADS
ncbi:hypothetical protein CBOM_07675 [Ceraceosorus bombacis]|uniref:Uncharacterized protein n=1 Tax=Ceraceosorus bombacis TaxID=401625 RepID=A0A0P1BM28_9BASI|nr:hypothetical protein CBOM_07675 [Ceraceosorus bombacis]